MGLECPVQGLLAQEAHLESHSSPQDLHVMRGLSCPESPSEGITFLPDTGILPERVPFQPAVLWAGPSADHS